MPDDNAQLSSADFDPAHFDLYTRRLNQRAPLPLRPGTAVDLAAVAQLREAFRDSLEEMAEHCRRAEDRGWRYRTDRRRLGVWMNRACDLATILAGVGEYLAVDVDPLFAFTKEPVIEGIDGESDALRHCLDEIVDRSRARLIANAIRRQVAPEQRTAAADQAAPEGDDGGGDDQPRALSRSEQATLCALATFDPAELASADRIAEALEQGAGGEGNTLSQRTIQPIVKTLVELGYAERPQGNQKGARATMKGRRLAAKLRER
jgi:hypothetical protein